MNTVDFSETRCMRMSIDINLLPKLKQLLSNMLLRSRNPFHFQKNLGNLVQRHFQINKSKMDNEVFAVILKCSDKR